jgi:hypothetical protein
VRGLPPSPRCVRASARAPISDTHAGTAAARESARDDRHYRHTIMALGFVVFLHRNDGTPPGQYASGLYRQGNWAIDATKSDELSQLMFFYKKFCKG